MLKKLNWKMWLVLSVGVVLLVSCGGGGGGGSSAGADTFSFNITGGTSTTYTEKANSGVQSGYDPYIGGSVNYMDNGNVNIAVHDGYKSSNSWDTDIYLIVDVMSAGTYSVTSATTVIYETPSGYYMATHGTITVSTLDGYVGGRIKGSFTATMLNLSYGDTMNVSGSFDVTRDY